MVKRFKSYITEESQKTLCDLLSGKESEFAEFMVSSDSYQILAKRYDLSAMRFKRALRSWLFAEGGEKDSIISGLTLGLMCRRRADWTYYNGGQVYRGLYKSLKESGFKPIPKVFKVNNQTWLAGEALYTSRYSMQSWSASIDVADHFAGLPRGEYTRMRSTKSNPIFGFVYEITVPKEQTLFNPGVFNNLPVSSEAEVIRTVNTPVTARVYLHLNWIKAAIGNVLPLESLKDKDTVIRLLVDWFGDAATKVLLARTSILKVRDRD